MPTQTKIKPLPPIDMPGMAGFLAWLRRDQRATYDALLRDNPKLKVFEGAFQQAMNNLGFDIGDALSSIGDTLANSAGDVASWLGKNAAGIVTAGAGAYVSLNNAKVAQAQLQRAVVNQPPYRTGLVTNQYGQTYVAPIQPASQPYALPYGGSSQTGYPGEAPYAPPASGYYTPAPGYGVTSPPIIAGIPNQYLFIGGGLVLLLLLTR